MKVPAVYAITGLIILVTNVILTVSVFRCERHLEALIGLSYSSIIPSFSVTRA